MKRFALIALMVLIASAYIHSGEIVYSSGSVVIEKYERSFISIDEMNRLLGSDEDYLLLDNRKPEDWIVKNIKGSVNANMDYVVTDGDYPTAIDVLKRVLVDKTGSENGGGKKIILACYTGNRYAQAATNILAYLGADMSKVFTLEGGNTAWDKSEYGMERKDVLSSMKSLISDYEWADTFEYAKRKGGSTLNLAEAMDVMTITTPCAFETVALDYGLNPSFYHSQIVNDDGGDVVVQNPDKSFSITFANGKKVSAAVKWPADAKLAGYLTAPDSKGAKVAYAVYDDSSLMIAFSYLDASYAKTIVESLKSVFGDVVAEDYGIAPYFKGRSSDGNTVSFSTAKAMLLVER